MSKYHSVKTELDGHIFDSKKEAHRYWELKTLQIAGEIKNLRIQPSYMLQSGFMHKGERQKAIRYIADFEYRDLKTGEMIVEDVKGQKTAVYRIKKKLFLMRYPDVTFVEV